MSTQSCQTLLALDDAVKVGIRPCERRASFISYYIYFVTNNGPSKMIFYVLVYEENETTYSVPSTRVPEMFTRNGLKCASTPLIIYSKRDNDKVLAKIDNKGIKNMQKPARNMCFADRSRQDRNHDSYPLAGENRRATIRGLKLATGMIVEFHTQIDSLTKYCLVMAAVKILYTEYGFQTTPMPTNLNTSYGVNLPIIAPPPNVLLSMDGLDFLKPLKKCFYRNVGIDYSGNSFAELIDFDSHNLICVETSVIKKNSWFTHYNNAFGDAPFYCARSANSDVIEVYRLAGDPIGYMPLHGKQIREPSGAQIMTVTRVVRKPTATNPNASDAYRVEMTNPPFNRVAEISLCEEIGQVFLECDISLSLEHKALLLASFGALAVYNYQIRHKFAYPQIQYYPFKSKLGGVTTAAPQ